MDYISGYYNYPINNIYRKCTELHFKDKTSKFISFYDIKNYKHILFNYYDNMDIINSYIVLDKLNEKKYIPIQYFDSILKNYNTTVCNQEYIEDLLLNNYTNVYADSKLFCNNGLITDSKTIKIYILPQNLHYCFLIKDNGDYDICDKIN